MLDGYSDSCISILLGRLYINHGIPAERIYRDSLLKLRPTSRWVPVCKQCHESFPHSEIGSTLADYFLPERPKFPTSGQDLECPNCKTTSNYLRTDLRYHDAPIRPI
jgi:hypothetical protein